ncbi:hypothetical protein ES702_03617 [subsurface metagenome]
MHAKLLYLTLLTTTFTATTAYVQPAYWRNVPPPLDEYRAAYRTFKQNQQIYKQAPQNVVPSTRKDTHNQEVMTPNNDLGPAIPDDSSAPGDNQNGNNGQLTISDILPSQRQINIFASLTRDVESLNSRLESSLPDSNTTLLAPLNSAMSDLPRKPWEDRPDDNSGISAASNEDKAARNLRRFVLEHVVPVSPWLEGKEHAIKTLWSQENGGENDREIWWETRGGGDDGSEKRKVIMPGEVVVAGVIGRVGNGEIWSLRGVVNYE